jgi:hypothetical protein
MVLRFANAEAHTVHESYCIVCSGTGTAHQHTCMLVAY